MPYPLTRPLRLILEMELEAEAAAPMTPVVAAVIPTRPAKIVIIKCIRPMIASVNRRVWSRNCRHINGRGRGPITTHRYITSRCKSAAPCVADLAPTAAGVDVHRRARWNRHNLAAAGAGAESHVDIARGPASGRTGCGSGHHAGNAHSVEQWTKSHFRLPGMSSTYVLREHRNLGGIPLTHVNEYSAQVLNAG